MYAYDLRDKRVAIYARFSSANQREASIEDQLRLCSEFVVRHGGSPQDHLVFLDKGVSGASLTRPGFERMMALASASPPRIDVIVTEDISRITRDLADGATVFKQLRYFGVPLIGISDGIDTSTRDAKMAFGMKALMSDLYLEELRAKTMRGLEGRALAGMSTGGLAIGYRSEPVQDELGRVVGHRVVVDEQGAAVVRRIFDLYVAGASIEGIARLLNHEKVAPPRAKTRHRRKGWIGSTVRDILHNAAYIGERSFKRRQWMKVPGTNVRRYRDRPASEVIRRVDAGLRIVDAEVWDRTQSRLATVRASYTKTADGKPKGRARGANALTSYPFSGLLRCGVCKTPMTIYGGSSQRYYRCGDYKKRGTCSNGLSLREDVARACLLQFLRENLATPAAVRFVRKAVAETLGALSRRASSELEERRARLARTEERIAGLVRFISDGDQSDYVRQALLDLEAQARAEKVALSDLRGRGTAALRLPSPEETVERALRFEEILLRDPARGRQELRRLFEGEQILVRPQPAGHYVAEGKLFPLAVFSLSLGAPEAPKARGLGEPSGLLGPPECEPKFACSDRSCAGPQLEFPAQRFQGVAEIWVPFEHSIAVGWQ